MLLDSVRDFCRRHAKKRCLIALSGGLDSSVLLDLCHGVSQQLPLNFHVIHVHHGLSPNANAWAQHCKNLCERYGFEFYLHHVNLDHSASTSLEEAARNARYQVFTDLLQTDDVLLTGHHQDDQAETVLLQLMRGAGPKGLSAMPVIKPFARGFHGRPLLAFSRAELLAYARERQLVWVEDESNDDCSLARNYLRREVLPVLKRQWPSVETVLSRTAAHCAEAQVLLEEAANERLHTALGKRPNTLSVSKLLGFSDAWQRVILRVWIEQQGYALPDTNKVHSIQKTVLTAAWDRNPCVAWRGAEVRRHGDDIFIVDPARVAAIPTELAAGLTVRFRVPGETVEIAARGKVSLKNLFQEWKVPVWERATLPLVFAGSKLVQVPGYFVDPEFVVES